MSDSTLFVIAYDLSDDKERRKADVLLQGFGFRRQKSLFECRLTHGGLARVQRELKALKLSSGFVVIYHIAGNSRALTIGDSPHFPDDDWVWIT